MVTYHHEPVSSIRTGDIVEYRGETFDAWSDAEYVDVDGTYNVLTEKGWRMFDVEDYVSITYADVIF